MALGASGGGAGVEELRLLGALAVLMVLALLATNRRTMRLRRSGAAAALISGGWVAVGAGVLLGPALTGVVTVEGVREQLTPLIQFVAGWVGLMLGLQLRRSVLAGLPGSIWRLVVLDVAATLLVMGGVVAGGLMWWSGSASWSDLPRLWWAYAVLVCGGAGWALETRSVAGGAGERGHDDVRRGIRAGGTLLAVAAALGLGLLVPLVGRDAEGLARFQVGTGLIEIAAGLLGAGIIAMVGLHALGLAGKSPERQLVVHLGVVALSAGVAGQLGLPAIAVAVVVGVVIANLQGKKSWGFERFILDAELVIAGLLALLAGVLVVPGIGVEALVLSLGLICARLVCKPLVLRVGLRGTRVGALGYAPVRQSSAALAVALSVLVLEPSRFVGSALTVLVITGVGSSLAVTVMHRFVAARFEPSSRQADGGERE